MEIFRDGESIVLTNEELERAFKTFVRRRVFDDVRMELAQQPDLTMLSESDMYQIIATMNSRVFEDEGLQGVYYDLINEVVDLWVHKYRSDLRGI